jgi:hypothetical protein
VNLKNILTELKRRNVYKVAIAYAVVAWLLMQVASQIFPFFEIPNWVVRLVVLVLVLGFPVALIIAWAFELTPEGLKRTEVADEEQIKRAGHRVWIYVVVIVALLSIGLFFLGRYTTSKQSGGAELPEKSIAILPFENLSEEKGCIFRRRRARRWSPETRVPTPTASSSRFMVRRRTKTCTSSAARLWSAA